MSMTKADMMYAWLSEQNGFTPKIQVFKGMEAENNSLPISTYRTRVTTGFFIKITSQLYCHWRKNEVLHHNNSASVGLLLFNQCS